MEATTEDTLLDKQVQEFNKIVSDVEKHEKETETVLFISLGLLFMATVGIYVFILGYTGTLLAACITIELLFFILIFWLLKRRSSSCRS